MRVLIDTNVYISHLLNPHHPSAVNFILDAWATGKFTLLVPKELTREIEVTVTGKEHLVKRIRPEELAEFLSLIREFGEEIPVITSPIPAVTRDPKDDYLLAYVLVGKGDYLVTGDNDLLDLNSLIKEIEILTPRQFSKVLEDQP